MSIEYITDHSRLTEVSLGNLGKLTKGTTYAEFMTRAREIAQPKAVANPLLVLAMKFKSDTKSGFLIVTSEESREIEMETPFTETVYPIADFEWDQFIEDTPAYLTEEADVHVVDSDKFTAPI